jgi:hypothetical protein
LQLAQIEGRVQGMQTWADPAVPRPRSRGRVGNTSASEVRMARFRRAATLVQVFGALAAITGIASLAAVLLLELWPRKLGNPILRRAACWTADQAPAVLLAASGAFLLSFLPFQRAFAEYRASNDVLTGRERLMEALSGLGQIPYYILGVYGQVTIWSLVTIVLTVLLIFLVARGIYRTIES